MRLVGGGKLDPPIALSPVDTIGTLVRDKDGISAALLFVELVAWLKQNGRTVDDYQRELAQIGGVWSSLQRSINLTGDVRQAMDALMRPMRETPPAELAGHPDAGPHGSGRPTRAAAG